MPRQIHPDPFILRPPDDLVTKHPELRRLSHRLSLIYAGGIQQNPELIEVVTEEHLQVMGRSLWEALDLREEFDQAHNRAGAAILPIIIESSAAEVQALPWETLYHPILGFLGKHPNFTL